MATYAPMMASRNKMKGEKTMKRKFDTIDSLHAYIERKAKTIINHYYTDWKHYDRIKMMQATGRKEKEVYIIFRNCGSYLFTLENLLNSDYARTIMDYYTSDSTAEYYRVDFDRLQVEKIGSGLPAEVKTEIARQKKTA